MQVFTYTQGWTIDNRLSSVVKSDLTGTILATTTIRYDGDGVRVKKEDPSGATNYLGVVEVLITGTTQVTTSYYAFGGAMVAMRTTATATLTYLHGDHLGSTSLTTNASGQKVSEQRYKPYGEVRWASDSMPTDFTFTSQRAGPANYVGSLMDYVARGYSPALGRFVSADTIVPGAGNPQALNRYMYVSGNPLSRIDPSGHMDASPRDDGCGSCWITPDYSALQVWSVAMTKLKSAASFDGEIRTSANEGGGQRAPTNSANPAGLSSPCQTCSRSVGAFARKGLQLVVLVADTGAVAVSGAHAVVFDILAAFALVQPKIGLPIFLNANAVTYIPFQLSAIAYSRLSYGATFALDVIDGQNGISALGLTIGQDTFVSYLTASAGLFDPDPNTDTLINAYQLAYDVRRTQGKIPQDRILVHDGTGWRVLLFPWSEEPPQGQLLR